MEPIDYTFNEDEYIEEIKSYIESTYKSHYSGKYQATDMIIDAGHGAGFCIGSIMKYAKRYGKKDGYNRKDILKIIHYGIILLHVHDEEHGLEDFECLQEECLQETPYHTSNTVLTPYKPNESITMDTEEDDNPFPKFL